jgi:hypothetical protein
MIRSGHQKSMSAFDRLPPAVRKALREATHKIAAPPLAKALKKHEAGESEIIERIRTQDAERVRRDEERKITETSDGDS